MSSQATSVMAWRRHRPAIAARLVHLREIDRTAFWEFCNSITSATHDENRTSDVMEHRCSLCTLSGPCKAVYLASILSINCLRGSRLLTATSISPAATLTLYA